MERIMTRRKAIPKAIELLQCLPQTEEVVEVIQALKKYSSTPLDRWDVASVYEALDEWTELHGGVPPKIKECDSHKELPSHMVFEKLFGKTAKEFLNDYYGEIEYVRIGRHGTKCVDDQYDFLELFRNEFERIQPATSKIYDACRNPETPSWGTIARRCKVSSWSELVTLSGVEANCIRRRYDTYNIRNKLSVSQKTNVETNLTVHEQKEEKERFEALLIKTHDLTLQAEKQEKAEKAVSKHTLRIGRK